MDAASAVDSLVVRAVRPDGEMELEVVVAAPWAVDAWQAMAACSQPPGAAPASLAEERAQSRALAAALIRSVPNLTDGGSPIDLSTPESRTRLIDRAPWLVAPILDAVHVALLGMQRAQDAKAKAAINHPHRRN